MRDQMPRSKTRDVRAMIHTAAEWNGLDHPWTYFKWMYLVGLPARRPSGAALKRLRNECSRPQRFRASASSASADTARHA
jgi:hypothetical protein